MIDSRHRLIGSIAFPIALVLITSGCATKKYVKQQVSPVHQQVAALEKQTNDKISYLNNKHDRDISQVNERLDTTDQRLTQVAQATQQAQGTASRAMEATETNAGKIEENASAITTLGSGVANALNFQLVNKTDVLFAFNQSTLTPATKRALDEIASQAKTLPRTAIELVGFTDPIGSKNYNYGLSRRRAEAVQRYLVQQNIPPRTIHIVGLGEGAPPPDFAPENPGTTLSQRRQMARRTQVRLFGAGDLSQGTASREK